MGNFTDLHQESILGVVEGFDRLIFKGHFNSMFPNGAFGYYLYQRGVLLKDAKKFFEQETARIITHAKAAAAEANRPFTFLHSAHTHASGESKEDMARAIAEQDGITEGLVCIFSVIERCDSFCIVGNRKTHRLEVVSRRRKCRHLYWYLIHPVYGWMHVRIQTWAPYPIQIYINGREQLCRQLKNSGIAFERSDNKILTVSDFDALAGLSEKFNHTEWAAFLQSQAVMVNPVLDDIEQAGFNTYWWVIDQAEYATDILFNDRAALERILSDLFTAAITGFGAEDVMHFLGRKLHHLFAGEVVIDQKKRLEGRRVKFRLKRNSIKIYDHGNVLRIETTINNPAEFKILRSRDENEQDKKVDRWSPMRKGVSNFWRYAQVSQAANARLINALANAPLKSDATLALDGICRSRRQEGRHIAAFNPVTPQTIELFIAVLSGEFSINGFRNRDLQEKLYLSKPENREEAVRRTHRVSRMIAKLRGHRLISKVKNSRLYKVTTLGVRSMWAAIRFRKLDFPEYFSQAQTFAL
jgi:hypothetical protein